METIAPRRVVVTGSESTGKTTLAERLAAHYGTVWVPEYARAYLDGKGKPLDTSDVEPIARGQIAAEDAGARAANRVVILDTDLVSTTVYAEHYYVEYQAWILSAARERISELYLLCGIDVPWVPDPQRDRSHLREKMHALFRGRLAELGANVVDITGSWDDRWRRAVVAVDAMLSARSSGTCA